jgi:hypothetical protein
MTMNMSQSLDPGAFHEAWLDTVMNPPLKGKSRWEAFVTPGACVKSYEREEPHVFPKYHGILVSHDPVRDHVVVRAHVDGFSVRCVWTGTIAQYVTDWEVD